jgi:hypothetical protein
VSLNGSGTNGNGNRLDARFAELKAAGRAGLVTFVTAGDPDPTTSLALVKALPGAGADVIELGMPFTDPMADGPAIQASSLRALAAGQTMKKTLSLVRDFRREEQRRMTSSACRRRRRGCISSAWRPPPPMTSACPPCCATLPASSIMSPSPGSPAPARPPMRISRAP